MNTNAIIAARLSRTTKSGQQGMGIDTQDKYSREWAERNGFNVVEVVADTKSGTVPPWDRKNLKPWVTDAEMMAQYDVIIAYKNDRLSRGSWEDEVRIRLWAQENHKRLAIVDGPQWPPRNDGDKWSWEAMADQARKEWESIRERNVRNRKELISKNKLSGRPAFGYRIAGSQYDKTLEPIPELVPYVVGIFDRVIAGDSLASIAAWLDSEHVPTNNRNQVKWQPRTLSNMIRCTTYIGIMREKSGKIILKDFPAIIDSGTFQRANDAIKSRPRRGPIIQENRALCSAVLFCPVCHQDSPMYRIKGGNGHRTFYYRCTGIGTQRKGCGNMVKLTTTDALVHEAMSELTEHIIRTERHDFSAELADVQYQLANLSSQGLTDDAEDAERMRLRAERDRLESLEGVPVIRQVDTGESYAQHWLTLTTDADRNTWLRNSGIRVYASHDPVSFAASIGGTIRTRKTTTGHQDDIAKIPTYTLLSRDDVWVSVALGPIDHSSLSAHA